MRAVERGELPPETDLELAIDLRTGRSAAGSCTVARRSDERELRGAVETLLAGLGRAPARPGGSIGA